MNSAAFLRNARKGLLPFTFWAFSTISCQASRSLAPIELVNRELESLAFDSFFTIWPDNGILAIHARLDASSAPLQEHERVAVRVFLSSGDVEHFLLEPYYDFPGPRYRTLIAVSMRPGFTVDVLGPHIEQVPARWWIISPSRTSGGLRVFDSRATAGALRVLRRDPRVEHAERDIAAFAGDPPDLSTLLFASAPLDLGLPNPGDGVLQSEKGAVITLEYHQPDGSVLTQSRIVQ